MLKKTFAKEETVKAWVKIVGVVLGLIILLVLGLVLAPQPYYHDGFRTLAELQEHASTLDEWIKMDAKNVLNPTYESYYLKKFTPNFFTQIKQKTNNLLHLFYLKKDPIFAESFFDSVLNKVTNERIGKNAIGDFIQKIDLTDRSKVIVFGPVQGAFHGLVRYLEKLQELGIINKHLKLTRPDDYIVFLGNVVNRSPYTLEIFSIILKLLLVNPNNVIYLKGTHEFEEAWKHNTLNRELDIRAPYTLKSKFQLEQEVESFFNTLPIVLYCTIPSMDNTKLNYFKLSPFIEDERLQNMLQESRFADFLQDKAHNAFSTFPLTESGNHENSNEKTSMKAIITGIKKRDHYEKMDGLRLLSPINGVIAWTTLSTAAEPARVSLKFFYDAFVIISKSEELHDWVITLYNRDIRNKNDKVFKTRSHYFFSGELAENKNLAI